MNEMQEGAGLAAAGIKVMADKATAIAEAQNTIIANLRERVRLLEAKVAEPPQVPPPVVEPPPHVPVPPPVVTPPVVMPPAQARRTADQIRDIIAAEMAKQTTHILTDGQMTGWVRHFSGPDYAVLGNADFSIAVAQQVKVDMAKYGWPPVGSPVQPPVTPPVGKPPAAEAAARAVEDMDGPTELPTRSSNYDWQRRAVVMMGNKPILSNTADWFRGSGHGGNNWWKRINGWAVLLEGTENRSYDVQIRLSQMSVALLHRGSAQWHAFPASTLSGSGNSQGGNYFKGSISVPQRREGGSLIVNPIEGADWHGWGDITDLSNPSGLACVAVTCTATLEGLGAHQARFGLMVGADYHANVNNAHDGTVVPAVAITRVRALVPNAPVRVTMLTLSDRGVQDPGGGITAAEWLANPAPIF